MRRPHVVDVKNLCHHCGESNGKLEKIFSRSGVVFPERKQERNSRENLHLQDDAENRHFTAAKYSSRSGWNETDIVPLAELCPRENRRPLSVVLRPILARHLEC